MNFGSYETYPRITRIRKAGKTNPLSDVKNYLADKKQRADNEKLQKTSAPEERLSITRVRK